MPLAVLTGVLLALQRLGHRRVATLSGVSEKQVRLIRAGQVQHVRAETARRLVEAKAAQAAGVFVLAAPTRAKLQRLIGEGYTRPYLAGRLGWKVLELPRPGTKVRLRTAARVAALYRTLMGEEGRSA